MNFREGDKVRLHRPEEQNEHPGWVEDRMAPLIGQVLTISHIYENRLLCSLEECEAAYTYNIKWLTPVHTRKVGDYVTIITPEEVQEEGGFPEGWSEGMVQYTGMTAEIKTAMDSGEYMLQGLKGIDDYLWIDQDFEESENETTV